MRDMLLVRLLVMSVAHVASTLAVGTFFVVMHWVVHWGWVVYHRVGMMVASTMDLAWVVMGIMVHHYWGWMVVEMVC